MIEETGTVTAVEGDHAWVATQRHSSCGSCSAKGCGTGALAKVLGARSQRVRVHNPIGAEVGEQVVLGIREDALVRGSLAVYIAPLLTLFVGALLGDTMAAQLNVAAADAFTAACGAAGLGVGLLWLRLYNRRSCDAGRYQPVILRRARPAGVAVVFPQH